jgi:hypothetical protein
MSDSLPGAHPARKPAARARAMNGRSAARTGGWVR